MPHPTLHPLIRRLTPWIIWGLGASAFFIEYLVRVSPAAIVPSLMVSFKASPLDISAFSAYFLYAYVVMQIPVGILVDRFGARLCLCLSTAICAFSTLLFSYTDFLHIAKIARLLLGFGAAFAWVGTLKLTLIWFKPQLFSILVGATQTLGMIGGAIGASLIGRFAEQYGWQISTQFFGVILGIIAILIAIFVRNPRVAAQKVSPTLPLKQGLLLIFKSKQNLAYLSIYRPTLHANRCFCRTLGQFLFNQYATDLFHPCKWRDQHYFSGICNRCTPVGAFSESHR